MNAIDHRRSFGLDNRMTVVLFAGMGGGCDGLEDAGFHVHLAVNHDPIAVAVHEKRHPHTKHLRCDVFEVDPREATKGRGVRVLHASPDCTHFSVAKGSKPVSKRRRSLAWVVLRWAGQVRPEVITMENVQEITTWGPLVCKRDKATGRAMRLDGTVAAKGERLPIAEQWLIPDPRHKGRIWKAFKAHAARLGYSFEHRSLVCADFGIPTIRKRFFGVMRADGGPIHWPERTHAPRDKAKALGLKPWVGAHTIIDWSLPVKSIFDRKKPLADATLRRIARGVMRYVVNAMRPFIVPICQTGSITSGRSVSEPLATITTAKGGELMLVVPTIVDTAHGEGQGRGVSEWPVDEPLRTLAASPGKALVAAHLEKFSENSAGQMPDEPLSTFMAGGQRQAVVAAHLTKFRTGATGVDLRDPLPTYTANSFHKRPGGAPPLGIVAATMIQAGNGEHPGQVARCLDVENPLGTQTAGGQRQAVVAAFLAQHNTGNSGHDAREPLSTVTTGGEFGISQQGVVAAALGRLRGADVSGQAIDHPLPTQTCGGGHEMLILPFLQTYYGSGENSHDPRDPLHTVTTNDRHGLVTVEVDGVTMVITDICMRMLDPLEGAAAHGFDPKSFDHEIDVTNAKGKVIRRKINKTEIGHLVGNSVPKRMVQLLAQCNVDRELVVAAE